MDRISRRDAIKAGATVGAMALSGTVVAAQAAQPVSPAAKDSPSTQTASVLSAYQCDKNIWVRINDAMFCCYRAGQDQKYPYIYPVIGPSTGLSVTEESSVPWPHHRSLFFGCDHVNGGNYWQEALSRGQIISRGPTIESAAADAVVLADVCDWRSGEGRHIIEDRRSYRFTAPDAALRILDARVQLTARADVEIAKTNHSFFSIRAARGLTPLGGGVLLSSAGDSGEKGTFGKPADWCGFQGTRCGQTESIVLMDHPSNPWYPTPWFTRDYGFASPTPFYWLDDKKPWRLAEGKSVSVAYRVVVMAGPLDRDRLTQLHREFSKIRASA